LAICDIVEKNSGPGAQTERSGAVGPVRGLLGGTTSPAAFFHPLALLRYMRGSDTYNAKMRGKPPHENPGKSQRTVWLHRLLDPRTIVIPAGNANTGLLGN
jgi:hypothetical protein